MSLFSPSQIGELDARYGIGSAVFTAAVKAASSASATKLYKTEVATAPVNLPLPTKPAGDTLLLFVDSSGNVSELDGSVLDRIIRVSSIPSSGTVLAFYTPEAQ